MEELTDITDQTILVNSGQNVFRHLSNVLNYYYNTQNDSCNVGIQSLDDIFSKPSCDGGISNIFGVIGVDEYFKPIGYSICELLSANGIIDDDLFLISQHDSNSLDTSRKISYSELTTQLVKDITSNIKVGTMAYEPKEYYSISSHNHTEYSKFDFIPNNDYIINGQEVGTINVSTDYLASGSYSDINSNPSKKIKRVSNYSVKIPSTLNIDLPPKPVIGTIKFIAASTFKNLIDKNQIILTTNGLQVNPYDDYNKIRDDFDGWIFPNGIGIENKQNQLSDASNAFDHQYNLINIPNISDFIKCKSSESCQSITRTIGNRSLPVHTHNIDGNLNVSFDMEFSKWDFKTTVDNPPQSSYDTNTFHMAKQTETATPVQIKFIYNINIDNFITYSIQPTGVNTITEDQTSYPTHNLIPVMMYIGGETNEYYAGLYRKLIES